MQQDTTQSQPYVRPTEAARMLAMGLSTLWARAKHDPTFAQPIKLSERTTVFRRSELIAWAEGRAKQAA